MTHTVLVVEPDAPVRSTLCAYLRDCGFKVYEAIDGNEALTVLQSGPLAIEAALIAVQLSGPMSGFDVAQWIRSNAPSVEVLLAGTIEKKANTAADLCDQGPHLSRPYDPQLVVDRIRRLLKK